MTNYHEGKSFNQRMEDYKNHPEWFKEATDEEKNDPFYAPVYVSEPYTVESVVFMRKKISEYNIPRPDSEEADNWLYRDTEFKKQKVMETGLYECHDDHFIAYKSCKKSLYSLRNYIQKYEPDTWVEAPNADCTSAENSFGLSAWTVDKALEYHNNGGLVKVKIMYEDVARVVHDGGKIRCFKLYVLEDLTERINEIKEDVKNGKPLHY